MNTEKKRSSWLKLKEGLRRTDWNPTEPCRKGKKEEEEEKEQARKNKLERNGGEAVGIYNYFVKTKQ